MQRCVALVDLTGFTALTQTHGDNYAADVHDAFVGALGTACDSSHDGCIKSVGDAPLASSRRSR